MSCLGGETLTIQCVYYNILNFSLKVICVGYRTTWFIHLVFPNYHVA